MVKEKKSIWFSLIESLGFWIFGKNWNFILLSYFFLLKKGRIWLCERFGFRVLLLLLFSGKKKNGEKIFVGMC